MKSSNPQLAAALSDVGWSPRDLIRALNPRLTAIGEPRLDLTAAHGWLNGASPRSTAVRRMTATLLTEASGQPHTVEALWPGTPSTPARRTGSATEGLIGPRSLPDLLDTATAWNTSSPQDQAAILPADGPALFTAAWDALNLIPRNHPPVSSLDRVLPPLMDLIETHLGALRRLDDSAGGGSLSQRYVHAALNNVLDLLRNAHYTPPIGSRLLDAASQLAQLAGWMAFDADLHAASQRYQLLGLRLARAADTPTSTGTIANILGMLAYQHATTERPHDALRFAHAAVEQAKGAIVAVRARALGRLATASAAAGDLDTFRRSAEQCRTLLQRRRTEDDPPHLYYFTDKQLDAETGQALVDLATAHPALARRLLTEATTLLTPLTDSGPDDGYRRSALLHGVHLARAHLLARTPDETIATLANLADHLPGVQSIRCRNLLQQLRLQAAGRIRSAAATDAFEAVDRALSGT